MMAHFRSSTAQTRCSPHRASQGELLAYIRLAVTVAGAEDWKHPQIPGS